MKRLLAILLTLSLASAMIPALAKDSLSIDVVKEFDFAAPNVEMDVFINTYKPLRGRCNNYRV